MLHSVSHYKYIVYIIATVWEIELLLKFMIVLWFYLMCRDPLWFWVAFVSCVQYNIIVTSEFNMYARILCVVHCSVSGHMWLLQGIFHLHWVNHLGNAFFFTPSSTKSCQYSCTDCIRTKWISYPLLHDICSNWPFKELLRDTLYTKP